MLTLTENANTIAATIVAQQSTTPDAGLRIHSSGTETEPRFAVTVASTPEPGDSIIGDEDIRVFLEKAAAEALDDKVLDASVDEQGAVSFSLMPQPA
ncbi:Fe-S cluster assembly protein HesB [Microbacterium sp. NPDC077391]|uniref:Fe-S cluster assembly protein HesB n=1 Tax=unclassified Microbacterium TaxID=2609290 RepID=UPI0008FCD589|nr:MULTISPECIES: Fe-S cluster assembly protein HesB [unclassified Microbacterium]OIU85474.1 Fe-S cluster assembly protein HesB [Microbacterium sp. AR7-10]